MESRNHLIKTHLYRRRSTRGWTLVEVMVATIIMSIAFLSFAGAFTGIIKSLHMSKRKTLASSLAQEKIEYMKNISYYRLLVTTAATPAPESGLGSFEYDPGYYPPESMTVGEMGFERRVLVEKVTESGGVISANNWYDNDTGLKRITAYVVWNEGGNWKKLAVTNLRENPERQKMDATFAGNVKSGSTNLVDATVTTLENPLLTDGTDASGNYSVSVPAGSYYVKASKKGYFDSTLTGTVTSGNSTTVNFNLTAMGSGTVSGVAYVNDHLVISQVVGSTQNASTAFCQEYVEVFNPSTYTWTVAADAVTPVINLAYAHQGDPDPTIIPMTYNTFTVGPNSYYLFANNPTISAAGVTKTADAYYAGDFLRVASGGACTDASNGADVVGLLRAADDSIVDVVGWKTSGIDPPEYEGSPLNEAVGLQLEEQYVRRSSTAGVTEGIGRAYDSANNNNDFVVVKPMTYPPKNSSNVESVISGTPASGAMAFVDDRLSSSAQADSAGAFSVVSVATGTWTIVVASGSFVYTNSTVTVTHAVTTSLGPVILNTEAEVGFVSGRVVNTAGVGLSGISVDSPGTPDTTDLNGYYNLQIEPGTHRITANPNNQNTTYTSGEAAGVVVTLGQLTTVPNIALSQGGSLRGYVTTGTNQLPNITIIATSAVSVAEIGGALSDNQGYFTIPNLATGTYTLTPQLEVGETASPATLSGTVTQGNTIFVGTFTVSNAFGTISGAVTVGGQPVQTGVIVVAVATGTAIPDTPISITDAVRDAATYYYAGSSQADGTYSLSVRGGTTYNLKAWYATYSSAGVPSITPKSDTATVAAGGSQTVNFTWP